MVIFGNQNCNVKNHHGACKILVTKSPNISTDVASDTIHVAEETDGKTFRQSTTLGKVLSIKAPGHP
jgi:hypothetical protein